MVRSVSKRNAFDVSNDWIRKEFVLCCKSLVLIYSNSISCIHSLTALEAAEKAYAQRLAKITTPEHPPIVIGRAQHQNSIHQQQIQQQQQQQGNRRPRSSTETDLHSHDPADDQSTVVNPRTQQAAMFWNRPRSRRSAGGDR